MEGFFTVLHLISAITMIFIILIQGGNQGGIGAAFGGGDSQSLFGASGGITVLNKITYFLILIFMLTSVSLTIMNKSSMPSNFKDIVKEKSNEK